MKQFFTFLIGILLISCSGGIDKSQLPEHSVEKSSLGTKGARVQINVTATFLPEQDCKNLIAYYKGEAKPNGQVSIHGPSLKMQKLFPNDPESKKPQVWAFDNLDGKGIQFNTMNYGEE